MKYRPGPTVLLPLVLLQTSHVPAAENLALGKAVRFAPKPNYGLTAKGDTDATDLTDGQLTSRKDSHLWFDSKCVGFSYGGLIQLSLDLGKPKPIGEMAIRLQGGSPQAGICFPGWVDAVVSLDGRTFYKVASYSRWQVGDKERLGIPRNEGKGWVHKLTFPSLSVRARYVGFSFYGSGLSVADELYVMRGKEAEARDPQGIGETTGFATAGVRIYFHKPVVQFSTNIATPNTVGLIVADDMVGKPFELILDLPRKMRMVGGSLGGTQTDQMEGKEKGELTRYTLAQKAGGSTKTWGRLYFAGAWPAGRTGAIRYMTRWQGGQTPLCSQQIEAIEIPRCPLKSQRLMLGLGWWSLGATQSWPDALDAFETIGFNAVPLAARWSKPDSAETQEFIKECLDRGLKIVNVDSPFHHMLHRHRQDRALYCQFADGEVGRRFCPSYRGPHYQEEVQRLARETARVKASYVTCDIELWNWRGPIDAGKCTRCQADLKSTGHTEIKQWQLDKGEEIWRDLSAAIRTEMAKAGLPMPDVGGYDFEPGKSYQFFWPFDRLYPEHMHSAQVSTYTPLEPYHLALIGDRVRHNRSQLLKSDVLPWLTPGDAGTFPGWAFRLALLECFCNGARGVYFWSGRVWDTETLSAFAHAIRNVAPVEDIIVDGDLLDGVVAEPEARVSGMRKGDRMLVLVADYHGSNGQTVQLTLPVEKPSMVIDQDTGRTAGEVTPEKRSLDIKLGADRARLLLVRPAM